MKTLQRQPLAERHRSAAPLSGRHRQVHQASPASTAIAASHRMKSHRQDHRAAFGSVASPVQRQSDAEQMLVDEEFVPDVVTQCAVAVQGAPNLTGMPNQLKSGIEALSGMDMSDVRVHRNSDKPARLSALAYAQGNEIHLGPGQERHLGHEAWHVVQQGQGRVGTTMQVAGVGVNDDAGLEREADLMGGKAEVELVQLTGGGNKQELTPNRNRAHSRMTPNRMVPMTGSQTNELTRMAPMTKIQMARRGIERDIVQRMYVAGTDRIDSHGRSKSSTRPLLGPTPLCDDKLNVVGENHTQSEKSRDEERLYAIFYTKSQDYWSENEFHASDAPPQGAEREGKSRAFADPFIPRLNHVLMHVYNALKTFAELELLATSSTLREIVESKNLIDVWNDVGVSIEQICILVDSLGPARHKFWFWVRQSDGFDLDDNDRERTRRIFEEVLPEIAATWWSVSKLVINGRARIGARVKSWAAADRRRSKEAASISNVLASVQMAVRQQNTEKKTTDGISKERSMAMHKVASNRRAARGVWKIGEDHRSDIGAEVRRTQLTYNLVSQLVFRAHFEKWRMSINPSGNYDHRRPGRCARFGEWWGDMFNNG